MKDPTNLLVLILGVIYPLTFVTNYVSAGETNNYNGDSEFNEEQHINNSGNYRRTHSHPVFMPNTNRGSQKFFQETQNQIYLLEEKNKSDSLLKIDKTISVDGMSLEDIYLDNSGER